VDGGARVVSRGEPLIARADVAAIAAATVFVALAPAIGSAEAPKGYVLDWDSGTGKSYVIPAAEVVGFIGALNAFNRLFVDSDTYGTDGHSIWENLRIAPQYDADPFSINQLGHPYQGSYYYGFARSAGLNYWESLGYTLAAASPPASGVSWAPPCSHRPLASIVSSSANDSSRCSRAGIRPCTFACRSAGR